MAAAVAEEICAHGVIITVRRHVGLASLLPWIALGRAAARVLERGEPAEESDA